VVCLDVDAEKIRILDDGGIPIHEPGLAEMVSRNRAAGRLQFTTDVAAAVNHGTLQFIGVGTPPGRDGAADLQHVLESARNVGRHMTDYKVVIDKSTVPVGTAERITRIIKEKTDQPFVVASNPEFLKEGTAVEDFMHPDRVVIGTDDERARDVLTRLYRPFFRASERIIYMDARSAEVTKYACNAYLATRVSFINDIANLCDLVGADVEKVRVGMGSDPRIGNKFLYPGIGYGGSCFPKDTRALINTAREHGLSLSLVASAERINEAQKLLMVRKTRAMFDGDVGGKTFALWGLAFKPETDDVREAPSLRIARTLLHDGAVLRVNDPEGVENFLSALGNPAGVTVCEDPYDAAEGADALLLVTEWRQYRSPDFARLKAIMRAPNLVDGRNQWDRAHVQGLGFRYAGIGR
jgi:UDPglucose 6-dehydrogenase